MLLPSPKVSLFIAGLTISRSAHVAGQTDVFNPLWGVVDAITGGVSGRFEISNYLPYELTAGLDVLPSAFDGFFTGEEIPANGDMPFKAIKQKVNSNVPKFMLTAANANQKFESNTFMSIGGKLEETVYLEGKHNKPGQTGVMIAPINEPDGRRWGFYTFLGSGLLPPLGNSAIRANIKAISAWIKANPPVIKPTDGLQIAITSIPEDISVKFAAVRPIGPASAKKYSLAAIVNLTGRVQAVLRFKVPVLNTPGADIATVDLNAFSLLLTLEIDLSGATPVIAVKGLKTSAMGLKISTVASKEIATVWPALKQFIDINSPFALAMVNSDFNTVIINAANNILSGVLGSASTKRKRDVESLIESLMLPARGSDTNGATKMDLRPEWSANKKSPWRQRLRSRQAGLTPQSSWMSTPAIQSKLMKNLRIPGTHDSATNELRPELSSIKYDDIAFLWRLDFSGMDARADGSNPFGQNKQFHLGPELGKYVLERIKYIATAQEGGVQTQLLDGIRWFDLRLYYDPRSQAIFSQHGLKGSNVVDIFRDVKAFFSAVTGKAELVMLRVSHTNFKEFPEAVTKLQGLVKDHFPETFYLPPNSKGVKDFNFQSLADVTLASITGGKNRVLIMNSDTDYQYSDFILNTKGYSDKAKDDDKTPGLWSVTNIVTPGTMLVVENIVKALAGNPEFLLKSLAEQANPKLISTLLNKYQGVFNLVTLDWYKYGQGQTSIKPPVEYIIGLNNLPNIALPPAGGATTPPFFDLNPPAAPPRGN